MLFWNIAFYIAGWGNWRMLGLYNYFRRFFFSLILGGMCVYEAPMLHLFYK